MRNRFLIILIAAILFITILVLSVSDFNDRKKVSPSFVPIEKTTKAAKSSNARKDGTITEQQSKDAIELEKNIQATSDPAYSRYYLDQIRIDPNFDWKQAINFWGKVVDENEQPVREVQVHFHWSDTSRKGNSEANTISDDSGLFSLLDRRGKRLFIEIRKDGYYNSQTADLSVFEYADPFEGRFTPNQSNPVIFRLRKKNVAESLLQFGSKVFIRTNLPIQIDLSTGFTNGGENLVQFELLKQQVRANRPQEWAMRITVPEGGIVLHTEEFPFLAPEEGYEPSIEIDMNTPKPANARSSGYEGGYFFVKTRFGYGRLEVKMVRGQIFFDFNSYFNPSGSRNLEPMESKPQQHELPPGVKEVIPEFK